MKTYELLQQYLTEFFLEWEIRQKNVVQKIKTCALVLDNFFPRKSCHLWNNVEKYGRGGQATDDNIMWRMRFARWITKANDTLVIYNIAFPRQQWFRERTLIVCTLPVFVYFIAALVFLLSHVRHYLWIIVLNYLIWDINLLLFKLAF